MRRMIMVAASALMVACGGTGDQQGASSQAASSGGVDLTGAGATFPQPIYSKWFFDYAAKTGVKINYQSIGSGGGIRQLTEGTVDFGASDAPMSDEEMAAAKGKVLHFPTVIGAVAVTYNLPDSPQALKFTSDVLADVFLGKITKWNDRRIAALNPGVDPARDGHPGGAPLRRQRHDVHLHRLPVGGERRMEERARQGQGRAVARGAGREGQRRRDRAGQADPGRHRVRGAGLRQPERPPGGTAEEPGGQLREPLPRGRNGGRGRRGREPHGRHRLPGVHRERARARTPIRSRRSRGCWSTRAWTTRTRPRSSSDFITWALHDGEGEVAALDYAPLPSNMVDLEMKQLQTIQYPGKMYGARRVGRYRPVNGTRQRAPGGDAARSLVVFQSPERFGHRSARAPPSWPRSGRRKLPGCYKTRVISVTGPCNRCSEVTASQRKETRFEDDEPDPAVVRGRSPACRRSVLERLGPGRHRERCGLLAVPVPAGRRPPTTPTRST